MESPEFYHKIEVVYEVNQGTGQADHPHLIQVQYPSHQQSPTLRDVKSRLTALRGRGMPDSYAWSYKRSYKGTFIWCDVFDDDVILPLGESGEYVLKALEVYDTSQDTLDRDANAEANQPQHEPIQSMTRNLPAISGATMKAGKQEITKADGMFGNLRCTASNVSCDSKQKSVGGSSHSRPEMKMWANEHTDACSTGTSTVASEDVVENKRCLDKFRRSESSTSASGTNSSTGTQTEPCAISDDNSDVSSFEIKGQFEVKELPSGPLMRSNDNGEASVRTIPSSEVFRKGPVKSRTWAVKEEDLSAPINARISRCSNEFYERGSMTSAARDIPASPVSRPCFPGHPLMFMLKKAARFHRSQLCRRVEVVETFRALPLEEPVFSRYTSKSRHGKGSRRVAQRPHFSKIVTLKSKPQRNRMSSEEPERETRNLSEFLETKKSRSFSDRNISDGGRGTGSTRHIRSDSKDAYGNARCREMAGSKTVVVPERVPKEDEKVMSDLKSLVNPELKSFKMVSKSAVRQSSKPGVDPSTSRLNPAPARGLQLPTVSRAQESSRERAVKQHRPLVAGFVDIPTRDESLIAVEDSASKPQDLKSLKVPRNVSKNCYFSLPIPGAEKRTSDLKVHPSRESSVFGSVALLADNMQEDKMVNPKLEVHATPETETRCSEAGTIWHKSSPPKYRGYKSTKGERPAPAGLKEMHWEDRVLQEAVVHGHPPMDMVLHECLVDAVDAGGHSNRSR